MAVVELTTEQVFELVRKLPPEQKREVLQLLANSGPGREGRQQLAEDQLRRLCSERGRNWDTMSADEREAFIDDLVHEDRGCAP